MVYIIDNMYVTHKCSKYIHILENEKLYYISFALKVLMVSCLLNKRCLSFNLYCIKYNL